MGRWPNSTEQAILLHTTETDVIYRTPFVDDIQDTTPTPIPDDPVADLDIDDMLRGLNARERQIIVESEINGRDDKDVWDDMQISKSAYYTLKKSALGKLRRNPYNRNLKGGNSDGR